MNVDTTLRNWFSPEMTGLEAQFLEKPISSNFLNDGPLTEEFEKSVAEFLEVKYSVAVTSGTIAITAALMACGIGANDEVLVPNLTFIATANAVRLTGAEVILIDVESKRNSIDIDKIEQKISSKTRAIVSVDVNGRGSRYGALEAICKKHSLKLICDSAEALGSKYEGKYLGTFGDAGCFSFSAAKTITTGQGGMVVTNDEEIYQRIKQIKDQGRVVRGTGGDDLHPFSGYNFKFTDLQAAVGLAQFTKLAERLKKMKKRDEYYLKELIDTDRVALGDFTSQKDEVRQWFDCRIENNAYTKQKFNKLGIGFRSFWYPLNTQKPYLNNSEYFPQSKVISDEGLWLPSFFSITQQNIKEVCQNLKDSLRNE